MARRSATELFEHYYTALVYSLPIKDAEFIDKLLTCNLISENLKIKLESFTVHDKRSSYFLNNAIKPGLAASDSRSFVSLLTVMKSSKHDNVKDLAKKIDEELAVDVKIKCKLCLNQACAGLLPGL